MGHCRFWKLLSVSVLVILSHGANCADLGLTQLKTESSSSSQFSSDFYQALTQVDSGNFAVSPFSMYSVLCMLKLGARGQTEREIASALHVNDDEAISQTSSSAAIGIANGIYIHDGFQVQADYLENLQKTYNVSMESLDFSNSGAAALQINGWVSKVTRGKIPSIVTPESISVDTKLLLVNAIYFQDKWKDGFNPAQTMLTPFHVDEVNSVEVDMMSQRGKFLYASIEELNSDVLLLPYQDEQLSLIIILPNERFGLSNLEKALAEYPFDLIRERLSVTRAVHVSLPRCRLESSLDLVQNGVLAKLGLGSMLTKDADFSGISANKSLTVDQVLQKVFIDINEDGTEAAAVSSVGLTHRVSPIRPKYTPFTVDHPFLAFVYDDVTKSILFIVRKVQ